MARNPAAKPNPAKTAEQQVAVYELRLKGLSIRKIAAQLGMATSTAQDRLTAEIKDRVLPLADEVRLYEIDRLDGWLARLERQLDDGESPERVVPVLLRVSERRAKLLGLDAPERAEVAVAQLPADESTAAVLAAARDRAEARVAELRASAPGR